MLSVTGRHFVCCTISAQTEVGEAEIQTLSDYNVRNKDLGKF
jgi:hypothetical protein